jgi:hypothetical protein
MKSAYFPAGFYCQKLELGPISTIDLLLLLMSFFYFDKLIFIHKKKKKELGPKTVIMM